LRPGIVQRWLDARVRADHPVSLVWTRGMPDYVTRSKRIIARDFTRECDALTDAAFASAYVPPQ
jgi:hypothetical protein